MKLAQIESLLPQTQCGQCGFNDCHGYAEALTKKAAINRCPPGGVRVMRSLAHLLKCPPQTLDPTCGEEMPPQHVEIFEDHCIGCTKCIQACPVDAVIGARKRMHTVLSTECTGCLLCIPACPMDCIRVIPLERKLPEIGLAAWEQQRAAISRQRYEKRLQRLGLSRSAPVSPHTLHADFAPLRKAPSKAADLIAKAKAGYLKTHQQ